MEVGKTLREKMAQMKTLTFDIEDKTFDKKERSVKHWISKTSLDRGKDIVLPEALDETNYRKNPIVLFNHNSDAPIARNAWLEYEDDGVLAKTIFGTTPFADDIYLLNLEKILNAWSIGFLPKTWDYDQEARVTTYTLADLLEYSNVSVPMNQDAVTEGLKMVKSMEVKEVLEGIEKEHEIKIQLENHGKEIGELKNLCTKFSERTSEPYVEDLEKAEREILELRNEINSINEILKNKLVGTSDNRKVFDEILESIVGDVS
ncbi:MAG: hypothetical protein GY804_09840 [Alphaproteobacteria bacterium]|nr:hypothetical protein [Alphaproteobacteria bacterium]